jgi:LuxR family maltose regulon positive regulatory protein
MQILTTKLAVPRPRPTIVPRPHLTARLNMGLDGCLTLISAPVGFGKTTLLGDWLAGNDRRVAWLSLDERDSDPVRFLRYLIAALQTVAPSIGEETLALLQGPGEPSLEPLLTVLLNEITQIPELCVLVLDDYHTLRGLPLHQHVAFLIEQLPPQLHMVISSREDPPFPLSRLRARGQLCELRAADLRFTLDEAAAFLNGMAGVNLREADIAILETKTEGWIAGLQLAALSMHDQDDVSGFIAAFTSSNRYILDYLTEEVLSRQSPEVYTFLLHTSILDRLCAPLCDALRGDARPGSEMSSSQEMLTHLDHANLFLVRLDAERRWYRYHHLFAELLRARLRQSQPDLLAMLHRHASLWFEREGLAAEAIHHMLCAQDFDRAANLIERTASATAHQGQVQTVLGWFDALPDAYVRARPTLSLLHAYLLLAVNRQDASEARLKDAERALDSGTPPEQARMIRGGAAATRANIARDRGDLELAVALGQQALELLPDQPVAAELHTLHAFLVTGDVTPTTEHRLTAAADPLRTEGNLSGLLRSITLLARLQVLQGRLRQAAVTYADAARVSPLRDGLRFLASAATYYCGLGDLLRECNDLDAADGFLTEGLALVRGPWTIGADEITLGSLAMARLRQARGESSAALATLEAFRELAHARAFAPLLVARAAAAQARLALAQGQSEAAVRWAEASGLDPDDADLRYLRETEYLTLARVLIAPQQGRARPSLAGALRLLDRLREVAERGARMSSVIEIELLRALAFQAQGDTDQALAALTRALSLARPGGYVRIFLDEGQPLMELLAAVEGSRTVEGSIRTYVRQLLTAFQAEAARAGSAPRSISLDTLKEPGHPSALPLPRPLDTRHPSTSPLQPPLEPLSPREIEVLHLIAAGKSNQEIAATLVVALSTVKRHVSNIYGKMDVTSRTQAVALARDLGLL